MPPNCRAVSATDDEVVAAPLVPDRSRDRPQQQFIAFRSAHDRLEFNSVFLAEAGMKHPGGGHAHAVAVLAEVMGQRSDETEEAAGI